MMNVLDQIRFNTDASGCRMRDEGFRSKRDGLLNGGQAAYSPKRSGASEWVCVRVLGGL